MVSMKASRFLSFASLILLSISSIYADGDYEYFKLDTEPMIRIGLSTNAGSVSITTSDSTLVAVSPDEPTKVLDTSRVTVSASLSRSPKCIRVRRVPSADADPGPGFAPDELVRRLT